MFARTSEGKTRLEFLQGWMETAVMAPPGAEAEGWGQAAEIMIYPVWIN